MKSFRGMFISEIEDEAIFTIKSNFNTVLNRRNMSWSQAMRKIEQNNHHQQAFIEWAKLCDVNDFEIMATFIYYHLQRDTFFLGLPFPREIFLAINSKGPSYQTQRLLQITALLLFQTNINHQFFGQLAERCSNDLLEQQQNSLSLKIMRTVFVEAKKLREQKHHYLQRLELIRSSIYNQIIRIVVHCQDRLTEPVSVIMLIQFLADFMPSIYVFANPADQIFPKYWAHCLQKLLNLEFFGHIQYDIRLVEILFDSLSTGIEYCGIASASINPQIQNLMKLSALYAHKLTSIMKYWKLFFNKMSRNSQMAHILTEMQVLCIQVISKETHELSQIACLFTAAEFLIQVIKEHMTVSKYQQLYNQFCKNPQKQPFGMLALECLNYSSIGMPTSPTNFELKVKARTAELTKWVRDAKELAKPEFNLFILAEIVGIKIIISKNDWLLFNRQENSDQVIEPKNWIFYELLEFLFQNLSERQICEQVYTLIREIYQVVRNKLNSCLPGRQIAKATRQQVKMLNSCIEFLCKTQENVQSLQLSGKFLNQCFMYTHDTFLYLFNVVQFQDESSHQLEQLLVSIIRKQFFSQQQLESTIQVIYQIIILHNKHKYFSVLMEFLQKYKDSQYIKDFLHSKCLEIADHMKSNHAYSYFINIVALEMVMNKSEVPWSKLFEVLDLVPINQKQLGLIIDIVYQKFRQIDSEKISVTQAKEPIKIYTNLIQIIYEHGNKTISTQETLYCLQKVSVHLLNVFIFTKGIYKLTPEEKQFLLGINRVLVNIESKAEFNQGAKAFEMPQRITRISWEIILLKISKAISLNSVDLKMTPWGERKIISVDGLHQEDMGNYDSERIFYKILQGVYGKKCLQHIYWRTLHHL